MHKVEIYADGAARGNPGRGGFGALLRFVDTEGHVHEKELSEGYELTTNNRMELLGVIKALECLKHPCLVTVTTDSKYVADAFNQQWIAGWQRRGWKNAKKDPVKNIDLWKRLIDLTDKHTVTFVWVKGHQGHAENERCDELATSAADGEHLLIDEGYIE